MISVKSLEIFSLCYSGQNHEKKKCLVTFQIENKNALTAVVCLACLEIRLRNEEAINSTRKRIYSLKVFQLLPTSATSSILQDIYFLFVSELIQAHFKRRSTAVSNSVDRIKLDFSTAVARLGFKRCVTAVLNSIHKL